MVYSSNHPKQPQTRAKSDTVARRISDATSCRANSLPAAERRHVSTSDLAGVHRSDDGDAIPTRNTDEHDIGDLLKRYRASARLTQAELADLSTVSLRTIRNLEAGRARKPRSQTIRLLADGLRIGPRAFEALELALGREGHGAALAAAVGKLPDVSTIPSSPLLGREDEVAAGLNLILTGSFRVITLAGFGGVGKSRLALGIAQAAQQKHSIPWLWVPLPHSPSALSDWTNDTPEQQLTTQPEWVQDLFRGEQSAVDEIARVAGTQRFLLVLDDVQPNWVHREAIITDLLQRCPRLAVMETTRQARGQDCGHMMPVKSLDTEPSANANNRGERRRPALELLLSRAQVTAPELVISDAQLPCLAETCHALDGLPRAIENAASWFALCRPEQVAQMAWADPFAVGGDDAYAALADAIDTVHVSQHRRIEQLSGMLSPWTLADASASLSTDQGALAQAIYELLAVGLIRPVRTTAGEPRAFTVLNHLRRFLG